jgi:hypothetical protein
MTTRNTTAETTRLPRDVYEHCLDSAIARGRDVLVEAAAMMRRFAEEMDRYATRYDDCSNDRCVKHEDVLSWAVNHAAGLFPNLRMDLMVSRAAEIAAARTELANATDDQP